MARTATITQAPQSANLDSLANNAAKPLGAVDFNTLGAHEATIKIKTTLASSGVSASGTLELYFIGTQDNVDWTDGIDPAGTADIAASIKNAVPLTFLTADTNSQVITAVIDLFSAPGSGYAQGCVVVFNKSGAALSASGNDADYQTIIYS